ncbi:gliding motility-associated C-terminal domain-containing protein [Chryseobacterium shandongense]|uniref:Gliding motility-associated C-terminal domain-containing protein n=1 Tax=Chryseobacterium shandongense TaxID=1493872 RepID=A0AAD1DMQ3_9FLAO|nr:T9SS type B sorting domain-containing protein [Chryseobacterium shandongense]AZA87963.1 gliding motility-associated C-terminal domain-containing protein [Chryseobacterium shandongense]AZA96523.1 gliding motility-associated C-terminal domain-containing protein [Chryseobacterium shandongense]
MKKLLLTICAFFCLLCNAQLDTDHWFAPMASKVGDTSLEGYLYLSTNETTPFTVQIFNDNIIYTSVQLSKGNPAEIAIPNSFLITTNQQDLFTPNSMGMYVKGTKKFFANYRFSLQNHAEIITSKGLAGLGTTFYAAMAPNNSNAPNVSAPIINSTIGITATEDNTSVVVSGYNPNVIFSDGSSTPTQTFTLNKGQSYIMDVRAVDSPFNLDGLIGAKIAATKPVSVTNGNFNGMHYPANGLSNNDILMDQAVPVDRLGKDFVVVKGNGSGTSPMESALVIATENNTQITINGVNSGITLNEGQYYMIPSSNYINQGSGIYNMGISTNKNAYVYQFLAGVSGGNEFPTGGMNFIPPLSCFLPNKIDEIGFINKIGNQTFSTRLNIITQTGATVTLNGNAIAASNGPVPVSGNPNWVTYSIPSISGTITVNSTKSVTAGIAAGSGAVGYGGYFAGFSSVPVISKTGDCYLGILLQVDNTYDGYQWYLNGNPIPGATSYSINPELYGAGTYTCLVTKNNCESKLTTGYNYTLCPPITITTYNIGSCNTKVISPIFTTSTQTIIPSNTSVILAPTSGTATVNPATGQITYTPNPGLTADITDTFIYYAEGNGNPADFEYFKIIINIDVLQTLNGSLTSCTDSNGNGTFDLTSINVTPDSGTTVQYFTNAALTGTPIANLTAYNGPAGTIYANVTSQYGCTKAAQITLTTVTSPSVNTGNFNATLCDDNFDGIVNVNFSTITPTIVPNPTAVNVRYYLQQTDANAGNTNNLPVNWNYTANTTVYVRVDGLTGNCPPAFGQIDFKIGNRITLITPSANADICDNDINGSENINLNDYKNLFTANAGVTLTFHSTLANAQAGTNAVSPTQIISAPSITFFIRFTSATECPSTGVLTILLKAPKKSDVLKDQIVCDGEKVILDAGAGFTSYTWSNGATTQTIMAGAGSYYVDLEFNGCIYRQSVNVTTSASPTITKIEVSGYNATVSVSGGTPPYLYSLNGIDYQTFNIFTGLSRGLHTAYVLGADQCSPVIKEFLVLNLINAITPNEDGINDILDYSDLRIKQNVSIEVVDRYGAPVYKSSDKSYIWNGKVNGRPLSTGTYWYVLKWTEPDTKLPVSYSGWLLIKNRE